MVYLTVPQSPAYHQISIEELLFPDETTKKPYVNYNISNTKTYELDRINNRTLTKVDVEKLIRTLRWFNKTTADLRKGDREKRYTFYQVPKRSGGLRTISCPEQALMDALRRLKRILEVDFGALYHTCAFAYIKNRSIVSALQRHQQNSSHWFAKFDLHDFFGSTTLDFVMHQLSMIFPFSEVCKRKNGYAALREAIELGFLNGGLPQGTPLSPTLTNIMMIPIDFKISKALRNYNDADFVYTRYADDFLVSSYTKFALKDVENIIIDVLKQFKAPFTLNAEKTRFGSNTGSGANWNLGLMLNAENEITIGQRRKKNFKSSLIAYSRDKVNGRTWPLEDIQHTLGEFSFFKMVERQNAEDMVNNIAKRFGINAIKSMRADLKYC